MTWVYAFQDAQDLGRELLGGKGYALAEMVRLGFLVPPGFTLTTGACRAYLERGAFPEGLWDEVREQVTRLEEATLVSLGIVTAGWFRCMARWC